MYKVVPFTSHLSIISLFWTLNSLRPSSAPPLLSFLWNVRSAPRWRCVDRNILRHCQAHWELARKSLLGKLFILPHGYDVPPVLSLLHGLSEFLKGSQQLSVSMKPQSRTMSGELPPNINIKEPRWDQSTFVGRANHFFTVTDPRNILLTNEQLENARKVVHDYRQGVIPPGLTENELWRAKYIYDSAFHPDTGEKMILIGRMSAQVPMNMTITGCMMTFYRTTPAVLFWQWINQSFNAVVNYTNRSGDAPLTVNELGTAYVSATTGAVATALGLNALTKHVSPLIGRFVPFAAVAAANCINIPLMRQRELKVGIPVTDENGNRLGESANAARQAITQVVISRILMAAPGMAIPPFIMNTLEKKAFLKRFPWMSAPIQVGLVGFCLVFATPLCCALFPQKSSMSVTSLEADLQATIRETYPELRRVYFNKGL
uniref:Sideroflexin-1 n=2 Tax=Suricata suricatta TaxID=37032 RepID=A0A673TTB5_SURSU